jgi:hypothetical protein
LNPSTVSEIASPMYNQLGIATTIK